MTCLLRLKQVLSEQNCAFPTVANVIYIESKEVEDLNMDVELASLLCSRLESRNDTYVDV